MRKPGLEEGGRELRKTAIAGDWSRSRLRIGNGMVPTELDEALVQRMCDDLFVMRARLECAIEDGLQLKGGAHSPQLEIA